MNQEHIQSDAKRIPKDPRISVEDLDLCVRCGGEISRKWNYCPNCRKEIHPQKNKEK